MQLYLMYTTTMKTKITHLILSAIFAVIIWYIASIATIMIIPILGYILTAMAQIMDNTALANEREDFKNERMILFFFFLSIFEVNTNSFIY